MFRSRIRVVATTVLFLLCLAPAATASEASPPPPPGTTMQAGVLVDMESGNVLWSLEEKAIRAPASLTKVLTALVAIENADLNKQGVISHAARNVAGGRMFAEEGWTMTVGDMLWGLLLQSGNDAAISIAETVSPDGTVAGFMRMANARAKELGATDSNFMNPHGLDEPGHQTTAKDLALITSAAMRNPTFVEMVSSKTHVVPWGDGQNHLFINHNKLLWRYDGTVGVKTGFTSDAGNCLISAVQRDGHTLIAVVMGTGNHYAESTALYDWGFANLPALKAHSAYSIRPDMTPKNTELLIDGSAAENAGLAAGSVQLRILIPALLIVCLFATAMVRRYSLLFSRT
ncbi:MAG TPA: D-alanyl-D-alanine carboxypeptidase family protein [Actinomycetota bacterium]|nr:D-alanyl-D-alanine carboxypeptidase family protein [Actinomycetota bacterium]